MEGVNWCIPCTVLLGIRMTLPEPLLQSDQPPHSMRLPQPPGKRTPCVIMRHKLRSSRYDLFVMQNMDFWAEESSRDRLYKTSSKCIKTINAADCGANLAEDVIKCVTNAAQGARDIFEYVTKTIFTQPPPPELPLLPLEGPCLRVVGGLVALKVSSTAVT